jgi:hypothetical protein
MRVRLGRLGVDHGMRLGGRVDPHAHDRAGRQEEPISMAQQSRQESLDQVADSLSAAVHITHDLWEQIQGDERMRGVVFFARHCLEALDLDNPPVADRALSKMDAARALIGDGVEDEDDKG